MSLNSGERQVAPSIEGIRADHSARYLWAAKTLPPASHVLDVGCGVGYGARILAEAGHKVTAFDRDAESIAFAKEHFAHQNVSYRRADISDLRGVDAFDAVVCFEVIEHLPDPLPMLRSLHEACPQLLASVPNETYFPFKGYQFHHRHYTRQEFEALLHQAGFVAAEVLGQRGVESPVGPQMGRTLVVRATRASKADLRLVEHQEPAQMPAGPAHVAILGLGPSLQHYVEIVKRLGNRRKLSDETWGINAVGDLIQCDRIFHLDDVRVQEMRAAEKPQSNIAAMLEWMKVHPGPIYTSRLNPAYPGLVEYPLQDVINSCTTHYFNSTAAYAVALAIHMGVKKISLFGCDFTYPDAHHAEKGRANVEFWLGVAWARGIDIFVPETTTLMDANEPEAKKFYGYDMVDVHLGSDAEGHATVSFTDKEVLPTAAEVEEAYNHDRHPNKLVRDAA